MLSNLDNQNQISIDHFFRGAFSIDIVLISFHSEKLKVLLQKKDEPFQNKLGLPGKLILPNEDTDDAMDNLLNSLLGSSNFYKKQLRAFSDPGRHPLGRIITFAYYGLIPFEKLDQYISPDLEWCDINQMPELGLDHNVIVKDVLKRFRKGLLRHPIVFNTLPKEFTLSEVIAVYENAFEQKVDVPNFRKKILESGLVHPLGRYRKNSNKIGRPAELFEMNKLNKKIHLKDRIHFDFHF